MKLTLYLINNTLFNRIKRWVRIKIGKCNIHVSTGKTEKLDSATLTKPLVES